MTNCSLFGASICATSYCNSWEVVRATVSDHIDWTTTMDTQTHGRLDASSVYGPDNLSFSLASQTNHIADRYPACETSYHCGVHLWRAVAYLCTWQIYSWKWSASMFCLDHRRLSLAAAKFQLAAAALWGTFPSVWCHSSQVWWWQDGRKDVHGEWFESRYGFVIDDLQGLNQSVLSSTSWSCVSWLGWCTFVRL